MKIVVSGYVGRKMTGIGRNLACLLENARGGTEFVLYTNRDMKDSFRFSNRNVKVRTYPVSRDSSVGNLLWTTFVFPFVSLKEHADRALIPNFTLLLFKFVPTYVIMHDLIEFNVPHKFSRKKMFYRTRLADPVTARVADRIITVSENSRRDIARFLGVKESRISVVYNGVDRKQFAPMPEDRRREILKKKNWPEKFLLYAGTVDHPGKNVLAVARVFEHLRETGEYRGKLVLAGMPGAGYGTVEAYVRKSAYREEMVLAGYVTDEELCALYSSCDVFCFVSLYEGFGIPPLEALSCGAKVVVSGTSSLPEVAGEVGWYAADPGNPGDVEKAVRAALAAGKDAGYREKVEAHLKKYDWHDLGKQFEEVMCNTINKEDADI